MLYVEVLLVLRFCEFDLSLSFQYYFLKINNLSTFQLGVLEFYSIANRCIYTCFLLCLLQRYLLLILWIVLQACNQRKNLTIKTFVVYAFNFSTGMFWSLPRLLEIKTQKQRHTQQKLRYPRVFKIFYFDFESHNQLQIWFLNILHYISPFFCLIVFLSIDLLFPADHWPSI